MSGILMGTIPFFPANLLIKVDDLTETFDASIQVTETSIRFRGLPHL